MPARANEKPTADLLVTVRFLTTEEGGRQSMIHDEDYRADLGHIHQDYLKMMRLSFLDNSPKTLGEIYSAEITFVLTNDIANSLCINQSFTIQEGKRIVATAKIDLILNEALLKERTS